MDVICKIKERSQPSQGIIEVRSDYKDNYEAIIIFEDKEFIVSIDELISALNKVKLNCFGE